MCVSVRLLVIYVVFTVVVGTHLARDGCVLVDDILLLSEPARQCVCV